MITQNDIVTLTVGDGVTPVAAQDAIVAIATDNGICRTIGKLIRRNAFHVTRGQDALRPWGLFNDAVVT